MSATCKRFFLISKTHKKFTQTITFSKCIINFDNYYTQFLQQKLLDLESALHRKFNEELTSDVFFNYWCYDKKISHELTLFKVFYHGFLCTRESRYAERCLICSRIFVDNNDIAKKIDSTFVITRNSTKDLDVFLLMK